MNQCKGKTLRGVRCKRIIKNKTIEYCHNHFDQKEENTKENTSSGNECLEGYNTCSICMEKTNDQNEVSAPCKFKHKFHGKCIMKWIKDENTCPNCREECIAKKTILRIKDYYEFENYIDPRLLSRANDVFNATIRGLRSIRNNEN
jgi:hypothetical protein